MKDSQPYSETFSLSPKIITDEIISKYILNVI